MARQILETLAEKVDPRWAALVVVDMQNDFVSPGGAWDQTGADISMPQEVLPRLVNLVGRARERGVPIIFIKSVYNSDDNRYLSDVFLHQAKRQGTGRYFEVPICVAGSWGGELAPGLEPRPEDTIVVKHRFSAFHNTDLDLRLRGQGIRTLLVTGIGTAVCVESTARQAFFLDYYNVVVADCCGAYTRDAHEQAVRRMDFYYGETARSEDVFAAWGAVAAAGTAQQLR
jgi:ureidoacrylate peracid hydrolase